MVLEEEEEEEEGTRVVWYFGPNKDDGSGILSKRCYFFIRLHGVIYLKTLVSLIISLATSKLTFIMLVGLV